MEWYSYEEFTQLIASKFINKFYQYHNALINLEPNLGMFAK